jgi:hypothetical protein
MAADERSWCQDLVGKPVLLVTGGGGAGKTRLGREACVQMLVAGWDAGLADDQRRDGAATDWLARRTLLVVDDADVRTGLIVALVDYLRWDEGRPPVGLLLLALAAGAWWDRLVRQQELAGACRVLDLDRYPVPLAGRAEHFRRASAAFAAYGGPGAHPAGPPPAGELTDPAYAEPLLIHIAALLRTVDMPATPAPPDPGQDRPEAAASPAARPDSPVRQRLLRAMCERERTRWHQLGGQSHLSFNPDLPLPDPASAASLLAALPNQAGVTRIGAQALPGSDELLGQQVPQPGSALDRPGPLRPLPCPRQQLAGLGRAGTHLQLALPLFARADRHRRVRALMRVDPDHH